ncbi:MAG TPA: hypothetical protein VF791_05895 [Pyrinomonadaceae bacterium]
MKSKVLALLLVTALLLAASPFATAQTNSSAPASGTDAQSWPGARDLNRGQRIRVEFKSGSILDGKIVSLNGSKLTLAEGKSNYVLEERDIQRINSLKGGWTRERGTRVGAIIGLVVGSIIGGRAMSRLERDPNRIPSDADEIPFITGMGLGTLVGAGLGALTGGRRKGRLLYEAK